MNIPIYEPYLRGNEQKYVKECLDTNWISSKGKFVREFEEAFAKFIGSNFSISTSNGTTALHLAMLALQIGQDDEVIVPSFTYIASVNSIRYVGATPVFVDSDRKTWQLDLEQIEMKITSKTKAILAVHIYGNCCNLEKLRNICDKHSIYLIEDCAEAIGTFYKNRHVGTYGDISTFSFFGNKTITTGEGGMVCTDNQKLKEKVELFRGQGVSKTKEYWHEVIGYNYRMTNICAAIGTAQLERVHEILEKKRQIILIYKKELSNLPIKFVEDTENVLNSHWMVSIMVNHKKDRDLLRQALFNEKIETRPFFHPIHLMDMYKKFALNAEYPNAIDLGEKGLNLPSSPILTEQEILEICTVIKRYFSVKGD